jgi:hypothetical protein
MEDSIEVPQGCHTSTCGQHRIQQSDRSVKRMVSLNRKNLHVLLCSVFRKGKRWPVGVAVLDLSHVGSADALARNAPQMPPPQMPHSASEGAIHVLDAVGCPEMMVRRVELGVRGAAVHRVGTTTWKFA